jgi:tetratricopeptide (TPR) repeat protein
MLGQTISHYRVLSKLGSGGMGVVYEAQDIRLGRRVALKFLPEALAQNPRMLQRFEREARAASSLNHPSICTIYEVEEHDHQPVIVMELLEGESLKERICKGPLSTDELLDFGIQVSDALGAAHAKGIIHRDIKPANLFLVAGGRVKILDFGLAKMAPSHVADNAGDEESLTVEGVIPGTTAYMSPEQVRGEDLDARSDLFSLGVVLYEMAAGKRPFVGKNRVLLMNAILNENPVLLCHAKPELPAPLDAIIAKALEKDRQQRYQHATKICSDLRQLRRATESGHDTVRSPAVAKLQPRIARAWKLALAVALSIVAIAGGAFFYPRRKPVLTAKDTIMLAEFDNKTGDPLFDGTLRQGMAVQLEQSPFLSMVSEGRIQQVLQLMGKPNDTRLTPDVAREICERTSSVAVLDGSIASLGSQYVLGLRAKNCRTGDVLAEEQAQAARKEDVLKVLSQIASGFRTRLGESLTTIEKHNTPLETATTPSLEALKAYSAAMQLSLPTEVLPHLKRAVEIDPQFAVAYAAMGLSYSNIGESVLSIESTSKAYELRERASDREKFFITTIYHRQVTGNLEKEKQTLRLWAQTYPRDRDAHGLMAGFASIGTGQFEKSIEEANIAIGIDPDSAHAYGDIAIANFFLDRFPETEKAIQNASEHKRETQDIPLLRYHLACIHGDEAGMDRAAALAKGKPGIEDWMLHAQALVAALSGRVQMARAVSHSAQHIARQAGETEGAATYEAGEAVWEGLFGNAPAARRSATAALQLSKGRDVEYGAAFALALVGDSLRSQSLVDDLQKRFPEDTSVQFNYLPSLNALLALNHREPQKALELLQVAVPYELAVPAIDFNEFFGGLYPVYVRGQAFIAASQSSQAAAEFQKILNHRGLVAGDPIGAMARLQLARALVMQGDTGKAKTCYQDFFRLWKEADPNILILRQAKAEYDKLQ